MKTAGSLLIIFSLVSMLLIPTSLGISDNDFEIINQGQQGKGYRFNIQGWVYIHLEGDPYERGYQYGYLAAPEIIQTLQRWSELAHSFKFMKIFIFKSLPKNYDKLSEQWWNICRTKASNTFLKQVPEEYQQEMEGMVDGIKARNGQIFGRDIDFKDILASQFVQEVWYGFYKYSYKRFHPIRSIINGLQDILSGNILTKHQGHCNAFIANGEYTTNGEIVAVHATIFNPYIAQRCNFIIDIEPSKGYRFTMTGPPGSLWSQEDWYQNEKGIILTETELYPQGPFTLRKTPKGVRSRTAIQYSANIDEVIETLSKNNNGLIPNEWLIGDTKTGEIASFQQALFNTPIKRTDSGYYWSCTLAHDLSVLSEQIGVPKMLLKLVPKIFPKKSPFEIKGEEVIWKDGVPQKLTELGEKYRGQIDIDIAKKMITTCPITEHTTDCKITDTNLMENLGLLAHMGVTNGSLWTPSENQKSNYKGITELPASGWFEFYPMNSKIDKLLTKETKDIKDEKNKLLWTFETDGVDYNANYSKNVVSEDVLYSVTDDGVVYALDVDSGQKLWSQNIGKNPKDPILIQDKLIVGTDMGLQAVNKKTGRIEWEQKIGKVTSKPIIIPNRPKVDGITDYVLASIKDKNIKGFTFEEGVGSFDLIMNFKDPAYFSEVKDKFLYVCSENNCYAYDYTSRENKWTFETNGLITSNPKFCDNKVFFGSWDGYFYAVNAKDGNLIWKYQTGWGITTTPALGKDLVYIGALDNNIYALDKETGELAWFYTCRSAIHSNPLVYGDFVFFGCDDGRFYSLNKSNGEFAWSFTPGHSIVEDSPNNYITTPILSNPIAEDGVVYISAKGMIYALDAQTIEPPVVEEKLKDELEITGLMLLLIAIAILLIVLIVIAVTRKRNGK
jgi:outer membrane protein assembly factor BamB